MYKGLYDCFAHWFNGGQVYFYSDPHFSDPEMQYIRKDYIGDEEQIKRINSRVSKRDTLVILGDIGDPTWVKKIRAGRKVLVMGNHDVGATKYKEYFDEVYEGALTIAEKVILSHEPIEVPGMFNIHGHTHGLPLHPTDKSWNVCAENIDYIPICWKEIVKSGMIGDTLSIHRLAINKQKERSERIKEG